MKPIRRLAIMAIAVSSLLLASSEPLSAGPRSGDCTVAYASWGYCVGIQPGNIGACVGFAAAVIHHCMRPE
jgi:hypothetical protein